MTGSTIKSANLAKVSEIDFVDQFSKNIDVLRKVLGITRMIEKVPGQVVKTYKAVGTLESGNVAEGADIPLSSYHTEVSDAFELSLKKWRKQVTIEAINDKGHQQAVTDTDNAMRADIQADIRKDWFDFMTETEDRTGVAGIGLKGALARLWAKMSATTEDYGVSDADIVYLVNQEDIADFLSDDKNYESRAEVFGMIYLEAFLGLYDVLVSTNVTQGKVFATPKNNLIMYYTNPANSNIAAVFDFTTDETGLVGIAHDSTYKNLTTDTVAVCGVALYAEIVTFIIYADIEVEPPADDDGGDEEKNNTPTVQSVKADTQTVTTPESVDSKSNKAQLTAYAEAHGIDISDANTNREILDTIQKAETAA